MTVSDELEIAQLKANLTINQLKEVLKQIAYVKETVHILNEDSFSFTLKQKLVGVLGMLKNGDITYLSYPQVRDIKERIRRYNLTSEEDELFKDTRDNRLELDLIVDRENETGIAAGFAVIIEKDISKVADIDNLAVDKTKSIVNVRLSEFFDINVECDDTPYDGVEEKNVKQAIEDIENHTKIVDNIVRVEPSVAERLEGFRNELQSISAKYGVYLEECKNVCYTTDNSFGGVHMTYQCGRNEEEITLITDAVNTMEGEVYL